MSDYPYGMWQYWSQTCGVVDAMEEYYSEVLQNDPLLQHALMQYKMAVSSIDARMNQLANQNE